MKIPSIDVLIVDDVLSAGTAGKESIKTIMDLSATPKAFIVGLDRQEKGKTEKAASQELRDDFNVRVESIVNLDILISFVKNDPKYDRNLIIYSQNDQNTLTER